MADNNIKLKRSAIPGKIPTTTDLAFGELAINTYDGNIYLKRSDGSIEEIVKITGGRLNDALVILNTFTGNGTTTVFTLTQPAQADEYCLVTINGVSQHVDAYSVSGTTLTMSEAPESGDSIEVRTLLLQATSSKLRDYQLYTYQPSTSTTTFSGPDLYGNTLTYDIGKLSIYVNGVKLVQALDYTATSGTIVVLAQPITLGDTIEIESFSQAYLLDWDAIKPNSIILNTTSSNQIIDTFQAAYYRTAKYIISISHATAGYHSEEILLVHNGTNAFITSTAQVFTIGSLGTISASVASGVVRLTFTPANINTTIKLQRITVVA